jgi:hypothetical protein
MITSIPADDPNLIRKMQWEMRGATLSMRSMRICPEGQFVSSKRMLAIGL